MLDCVCVLCKETTEEEKSQKAENIGWKMVLMPFERAHSQPTSHKCVPVIDQLEWVILILQAEKATVA